MRLARARRNASLVGGEDHAAAGRRNPQKEVPELFEMRPSVLEVLLAVLRPGACAIPEVALPHPVPRDRLQRLGEVGHLVGLDQAYEKSALVVVQTTAAEHRKLQRIGTVILRQRVAAILRIDWIE